MKTHSHPSKASTSFTGCAVCRNLIFKKVFGGRRRVMFSRGQLFGGSKISTLVNTLSFKEARTTEPFEKTSVLREWQLPNLQGLDHVQTCLWFFWILFLLFRCSRTSVSSWGYILLKQLETSWESIHSRTNPNHHWTRKKIARGASKAKSVEAAKRNQQDQRNQQQQATT